MSQIKCWSDHILSRACRPGLLLRSDPGRGCSLHSRGQHLRLLDQRRDPIPREVHPDLGRPELLQSPGVAAGAGSWPWHGTANKNLCARGGSDKLKVSHSRNWDGPFAQPQNHLNCRAGKRHPRSRRGPLRALPNQQIFPPSKSWLPCVTPTNSGQPGNYCELSSGSSAKEPA